MLTIKELKILKLVFTIFKGKHADTETVFARLKKEGFPSEIAFEVAYLYDHNFVEDGDFKSIENPERVSYDQFLEDSLTDNVKLVMEVTGDDYPGNYTDNEDNTVEHDGVKYTIFTIDEVDEMGFENGDWICDDPSIMGSYYIDMDHESRIEYADSTAEDQINNMDDEEILQFDDSTDEYEELTDLENELDNLKSEIEDKTFDMESLVHELDDAEDEEKKILEEKIAELETLIEELEEKVEDIGDIEQRKTKLVDEARERVKESISDNIYEELNDPVSYFIEQQGMYTNINELVNSGLVDFDCDQAKRDYISDASYEDILNWTRYHDHEYEEVKNHIIVWKK